MLDEPEKLARFEQNILAHLDAAYNLARWLCGNDSDASDLVQDACLRAFKFFDRFRGGSGRAWLLRIVRNGFYDRLKQDRRAPEPFDEALHDLADEGSAPDALLAQKADQELVGQALAELPVEFREILILRELEGMSYREIAEVADLPLGTVMSRLARGRQQLRARLVKRMELK